MADLLPNGGPTRGAIASDSAESHKSHNTIRGKSYERRTMARRYPILFLLVLALAVPAFANHSWGGYHWARTSNPFTLKVGDNVTSPWDGILNTTISDW